MLDILKKNVSKDITVGIGAYTDVQKITQIVDNFDLCPLRILKEEETALLALKRGDIDCLVRGTLRSSHFLRAMKKVYDIDAHYRIALLGTKEGKYFLLAPVGIDEGESLQDKVKLVEYGKDFLSTLNIEPKISILSGGRWDDIGRSRYVDVTIIEARMIAEELGIKHHEIMIEEAIKDSNFIIAPDGISGNLIYRSLVHLGCGTSHGALYYPHALDGEVIVDTSRTADALEYETAIILANAFKVMKC
ncbi:MAG: methanogenesis marker protein Mmp4/MtxX [Candidatus Methanofastidiosa archaeon]|nr:methanogenesis marker protein Mmp4/MtxX [Candidatus Methanofastidiosa archaeon]